MSCLDRGLFHPNYIFLREGQTGWMGKRTMIKREMGWMGKRMEWCVGRKTDGQTDVGVYKRMRKIDR